MSDNTRSTDSITNANARKFVRRVCIPEELMNEITASGLRGLRKDLIYWIIYRCLTTKAGCCAIDQGLLDVALGHRVRKDVIRFIKGSRYLQAASNGFYRFGKESSCKQCKRYELCNIPLIPQQLDHHYTGGRSCDASGLWIVGGCVVWRSVDFECLWLRIKKGFDAKNWTKSVTQSEWSLCQLDEPELTPEEIIEHVGDGEQADAHIQSFERFKELPDDSVFRRDGRTYSPVTSLPKWIREQEIKFQGESESLDVSCCYLWCLAGEHRMSRIRRELDTVEVDRLMDMIEAGDFYAKIAEIAGVETDEAKQNFQKFCLFGPIGWHPLWKALQQICPGICAEIRWWRNQPGGASRLAFFLQRCECGLMTDGLMDWLISGGLPAIGIHDGCIVPEGAALLSAQWLKDHSKRLYGRSCRVAVVINGTKSSV